MRATCGPYKGREIKISRPQPFILHNPNRRIEVENPYSHAWTPLYVLRVEIKNWTK